MPKQTAVTITLATLLGVAVGGLVLWKAAQRRKGKACCSSRREEAVINSGDEKLIKAEDKEVLSFFRSPTFSWVERTLGADIVIVSEQEEWDRVEPLLKNPDKLTMEDFWTLVWEQDVHTILTLLPWQEKGEVPREACWPLEGDSLCTKMLTIQCGTEKLVSGWRCNQLKMKHEKKAKERQVQRFLYMLWSSKKQPDVESLLELLTAVRRCMPHRKRAGPLLLHCSSGVSQMGTLISLDCLLHQMKAERIVDVYGVTLQLMRSCCLMTPTLDQYMFLYTCMRDIIAQQQP